MNTFKKLIFGLLLSGMALTVGCNDDKKPQAGEACEAKDACDEGLKCIIKKADDKKGTCAVACTSTTEKEKCKKDGAKSCVKGIEHGTKKADANVCGAKTGSTEGTAALGKKCKTDTTNLAEKCKSDLVCITITGAPHPLCATKCETEESPSQACDASKGGPDCISGATKEGGTEAINVCYTKVGGPTFNGPAAGEACENADAKKCDTANGIYCVVEGADPAKGVCRAVTACDAAVCTGMKECADVPVATGTDTVQTCVDKDGTAAAGDECDNSALDKKCAPDLVCQVAAASDTQGTCVATCDPNAATPCSVASESCEDATVLTDSTPGKVCK